MPRSVTDIRTLLVEITRPLFTSSLLTFLILCALEWYKRGFVTNVFNPIWLLIFAVIAAMVTTLLEREPPAVRGRSRRLLALLVSIGVGNFFYAFLSEGVELYRVVPWVAGVVTYLSLVTIAQYD